MHLRKVAMKYQIEWHWCSHTFKKGSEEVVFPLLSSLSSWKRMYKYVSHLQSPSLFEHSSNTLKVAYRSALRCVFSCCIEPTPIITTTRALLFLFSWPHVFLANISRYKAKCKLLKYMKWKVMSCVLQAHTRFLIAGNLTLLEFWKAAIFQKTQQEKSWKWELSLWFLK